MDKFIQCTCIFKVCSCTNLEPEWSLKSVNINQKSGVLLRSEGILAVVKLGPEVVTWVFLDNDGLSVPLGFYIHTYVQLIHKQKSIKHINSPVCFSMMFQFRLTFFHCYIQVSNPWTIHFEVNIPFTLEEKSVFFSFNKLKNWD